jgi:hypothetical protein
MIPILLLYGLIIIAVIGSFMWPIMYWNERKDRRKAENKSISKSDYIQEFIFLITAPYILLAMGVLYLLERL